jgi:TonB-dependent receptor
MLKVLPSLLLLRVSKRVVCKVAFMLLFALAFADVHAQKVSAKVVNVQLNSNTIVEAVKKIETAAGTTIYYQPSELKAITKSYSGLYNQKTVAQILDILFAGTEFTWVEMNEKIVIKKEAPKPTANGEGGPIVIQSPFPAMISGVVVDEQRRPLVGVSVRLKGVQGGTTTKSEGRYLIRVPKKDAVLVFSYVGYDQHEHVVIDTATVDITLLPLNSSMAGVTVSARKKVNTEASLLNERKLSSVVSDGISAQLMEKTASITTTQALQRVSGVTVTDEKYVAVRGLGDRSVIGQLNGIRLASSDPDRSTIPLDLIPAALLDNVTVYKSMTPDKPSDASSGIVELKTKSVPDKQTISFTIQTGTNTQNGNGINSFYNSDMGFLGQKVKNKGLSQDFLDLATKYPNGLSDVQKAISASRNDPAMLAEAQRINGIMHQFDPVLTTRYKPTPVNQIYSLTYGNSFRLFKNRHQLGVILGGNYYNRANDIYGGELTQWSLYQGALTGNPAIDNPRVIPNYVTPNNINLGKYLAYKENTGTQTLNYGYLAGLTYRFNSMHEISVQYLGSRGAETKASNLYGAFEYIALPGGISNVVYSLRQNYRVLNTFNLQGEHKLFAGEYSPRLSYNLASSSSSQDEPDFRFANLAAYKPRAGAIYDMPSTGNTNSANPRPTDHLYSLISGYVNGYGPYGIIQADPNGRRFRKLNEDSYNHKADLSIPFPLFKQKQLFKAGVNYLHRKRSFGENVLFLPGSNFSNAGALPLYETYGNLDRLVAHDRIGIRPISSYTGEGQPPLGGYLYNTLKSPNNYKGYFETRAFYGMLDLKLTEQLRLTGGVRFEMTDIKSVVDTSNVYLDPSITATDANGNTVNLVYVEPNSVYKTDYTPYYSANLTYTLNKNMNFRLGYNNSLARPELRELTNVFDFDPFQFALVVGNPNLVNQKTTNYDFRWEWFPASGEVFSASVFYKQIDNQLTKVFKQNSEGLDARFPEFPAIEFQNDPNRGHVYGIELEIVKNMGLLTPALKNFFIGSNLLLAQSDIKKTPERLESSRAIDRKAPSNSPLFEQAPYSINAYITYSNKKLGTDITTSFNMVGERLIQVNLDGTPDLYTRPLPVLDLVFTQQLTKRMQLKGFAKNILDRPYEEVYANPGTGGMFYGTKYLRRSYRRGTELMLGVTYTF